MKEIIQIKGHHFQINFKLHSPKHWQTIVVFRKAWKHLISLQLQTIPICSRTKIEFSNPNNPRKNEIKRRVQNLKNLGNSCNYNRRIWWWLTWNISWCDLDIDLDDYLRYCWDIFWCLSWLLYSAVLNEKLIFK